MKLLRLVLKNLLRHRGRTLLSIGGVASALALLVLVESLALGLERVMSGTESARTLVVYRKNRYCPQTSFLPEWYAAEIETLEGVESVLPVKVYLNNCRASLDVVAFQGSPVDRLLETRQIEVVDGDLEAFRGQGDAALVGADFATRKGLRPGETFRFGDIDVKVSGIFESTEPSEEALILTHLEFLQRASGVKRLGTVTQIEVRVTDASRARDVAAEIDARFATAEEPTDTRPRVAFLESATRDLREILRFGRWLGLACVVVVLALVANTVFMSASERVKEFGVFRTFGFREVHVAGLVGGEALVLAVLGALLGVGGALTVLSTMHLGIGSEGVTVSLTTTPALVLRGFAVAVGAGTLAGLVPAVQSARSPIVASLRR